MSKQKKKEEEETREEGDDDQSTIEKEEGQSFNDIDKLQESGISATDIAKLKQAGCYTVESILMRTKKDLGAIKGISEGKVDKIVDAAFKLVNCGFITGTESLNKRKEVIRLTTGSKALDKLLGGGIETCGITEAFGEFRTGKTQICHTLCVTAQLPIKSGGGNGKVAFIDTEGTFRPERIGPIAERFGLNGNEVLENIIVARAFTHEHQMNLLNLVVAKMSEEPFRLLIVDSVTSLFRVDFSGRGTLSERQQKLGKYMSCLMKVAEEFNVAVLITNQVMSDPSGAAMFVQDSKKPIGGHVVAHASTTRLYLKKGRGEQRVCKVYDSPCLPEAEAVYQITDKGITDSTE